MATVDPETRTVNTRVVRASEAAGHGTPEESCRRGDIGLLLAAALACTLLQLRWQPLWLSAGFLLLFSWRAGLALAGREVPGRTIRILAAVACAAAVYAQFHGFIGREPGVALLVLFLGLKLLETQTRRDCFVVIYLCFFLLLTTFFHVQTMLAAALVVLALCLLVAVLLSMSSNRQAPRADLGPRLRQSATMLLQAAPLAIVLFIVFPRLPTTMWSSSSFGQAARTGLAETMAPGTIAELSQSDEIAFRVQFDSDPERAALYWRGPVLERFDGRSWSSAGQASSQPPLARVEVPAGAPRYRYAVTLEPTGQRWMFALDAPLAIDSRWATRSALDPALVRVARNEINERIRYEMLSATSYRLGASESPATLHSWQELPAGSSPRTRALAQRWRSEGASASSDRALVARALRLFATEEFHYTTRPPLLGDEPTDEFLFDTRAGFCEHYASAFVVLMRALGIPARVVTGYQGGEYNANDGYWIVRQFDAHAWAEVWIAGQGWLRIDPTAAVAPERIERGAVRQSRSGEAFADTAALDSLRHRLALRLDALTHAWNQWVLAYDDQRQHSLLRRLGLDPDDWRSLAGLFAAIAMLVIGICALLAVRPRRARDPIERAWTEFCNKLEATGIPRERHETAWQYHARLSRLLTAENVVQARRIVVLYNRLRYGGAASASDMQDLCQSVARFQP